MHVFACFHILPDRSVLEEGEEFGEVEIHITNGVIKGYGTTHSDSRSYLSVEISCFLKTKLQS